MNIERTTVVVEDGDGFVAWRTPKGRVIGRCDGALDIEAETPEVLAEWARKVLAAVEGVGSPAPDPDRHEPGRRRLSDAEWPGPVPWSDIRVGDEVRHGSRWLSVVRIRPIGTGHPLSATHGGCLDVTLSVFRQVFVEPTDRVSVRFPRDTDHDFATGIDALGRNGEERAARCGR